MLEARIKTNLQKRDQDIMKFVCVYGGGGVVENEPSSEHWKQTTFSKIFKEQKASLFGSTRHSNRYQDCKISVICSALVI